MDCPRVKFTITRPGQTLREALRKCVNDSLAVAFKFCQYVNEQCPEPGLNPIEVEFVEARRTGTEIEVQARLTYQCHPVGQGCLLAPFVSLFGLRRRPTRPESEQSLEELLGLEMGNSASEDEG